MKRKYLTTLFAVTFAFVMKADAQLTDLKVFVSHSISLPNRVENKLPKLNLSKADERCLAETIYYEARNQPRAGKEAVGIVTVNRMLVGGFGKTICNVIHASVTKNGVKRCAYSWYCNKVKRPSVKEGWNEAKEIASKLNRGEIKHDLFGATYFKRFDVFPKWNKYMVQIVRIRDHEFYIDLG